MRIVTEHENNSLRSENNKEGRVLNRDIPVMCFQLLICDTHSIVGRPAQVYRPNALFGSTAISEGQLVSNAKAVFQAQREFLRFAILRVGRPAQVYNAFFGPTAISEGQPVSNAKAATTTQQ